jgi:5-methylcytosine-specific restriction enzyme subunit McrC
MMAYGRLYRCDHLTLLYPHHMGLRRDEGVLAAYMITGSDHSLETATIDVSCANEIAPRLKRLIDGCHGACP